MNSNTELPVLSCTELRQKWSKIAAITAGELYTPSLITDRVCCQLLRKSLNTTTSELKDSCSLREKFATLINGMPFFIYIYAYSQN